MKDFFAALLVTLCLALPSALLAAATATIEWVPGQPVKIVKVAWTSDAAGQVWNSIGEVVNGKVFEAKTIPGTGGDTPSSYGVYVRDYDVPTLSHLSATAMTTRSTTATEVVLPANIPVYGPVGFSVTGAGDTNKGECWLYVEVPN